MGLNLPKLLNYGKLTVKSQHFKVDGVWHNYAHFKEIFFCVYYSFDKKRENLCPNNNFEIKNIYIKKFITMYMYISTIEIIWSHYIYDENPLQISKSQIGMCC